MENRLVQRVRILNAGIFDIQDRLLTLDDLRHLANFRDEYRGALARSPSTKLFSTASLKYCFEHSRSTLFSPDDYYLPQWLSTNMIHTFTVLHEDQIEMLTLPVRLDERNRLSDELYDYFMNHPEELS